MQKFNLSLPTVLYGQKVGNSCKYNICKQKLSMNEKCYNLNYLEKFKKNSFIHERNAAESENIYSYETVIAETSKCLQYFQSHQVKCQTGIAIDLKEHSAATCILLLGILNHDCHFYCMDLDASKDAASSLKASGVQYVISPYDLDNDHIKKLSNDLTTLKNIYCLYKLENCNSSSESNKLCYTISTSGSTGVPKMVHVPFECIEPNVKSFSKLLAIQENDMLFLGSPPTFDPFVLELFVALENGAKILITTNEARLLPQQLLKILFPEEKSLRQGVTIYQTTPAMFRLFGQESIKNILNGNSSLRCLILGGEDFPCNLELKTWLPNDFFSSGKRIFNVYGITEVSCWSSIYELEAKSLEYIKVPLGSPLDDFTYFRLMDDSSNVLPDCKECKGELEIGSCIRHCFIPQQDNNDVQILERKNIVYRKTGDLVERDSLGNIYYIGRLNNTIKRFGKRICLDSLDKKLKHILHEHKIPFNVISLWHHETSKLIACLFKSQERTDTEQQIVANVFKKTLDIYEQPDKIFYSKQLPLNAHGKIDRQQVWQQLCTNKTPLKIFEEFLLNVLALPKDLQANAKDSSPLTATNKRLKLSTDLSFSQAGGTSFQALSLATEIAELLAENHQQRKILEMLLDSNVTINDILIYLRVCSTKLDCHTSAKSRSVAGLELSLNMKLLWRCDLKKCIDAAPSLFADKYVSVGSHSHILLTVNALTGAEISRLEFNDRIECAVVFITPQLAVAGCYDGFLYGFDFHNGTVLFRLNAGGMIKAKPLLVEKTVIAASYAEDYNALAFDIESLALVWKLKVGSKGIFSSPVQISTDSVLFCGLDGTYALLHAQTGLIHWQQQLDSPIFSTALKIQTQSELLLVLAEVKGLITICKAANGNKLTTFQADGNIFSGLTLLADDRLNHSLILFGCHDKNVYCLELEHDGKQLTCLAKYALNAAVYATPVVVLKTCVLACSTKGLIVLWNVLRNIVLASVDLKAEVFSTPNCLNDKYFYIGSRDNYLYCFQLE